jgi:hypothetical protein
MHLWLNLYVPCEKGKKYHLAL